LTTENQEFDYENCVFPLSNSQRAFWYLHQITPTSPAYNIPVGSQLLGPFDVDALQQSIDKVIERHEIFRTTYSDNDGKLQQIVHSKLFSPIEIIDLSTENNSELVSQLDKSIQDACQRPFDLRNGSAIHTTLIVAGIENHYLIINIHHIAADQITVANCLTEIQQCYSAYSRNSVPQLTPPEFQYVDFVAQQIKGQNETILATKLGKWKNRLSAYSGKIGLPVDFPRPPKPTYRGAQCSFQLGDSLSSQIETYCRASAVSEQVTLLTSLSVLLKKLSYQDDIIIGTPFTNRTEKKLEKIFGCFSNTLPIAATLSTESTFNDLVKIIQDAIVDAKEDQDLGFERIVEAANPHRDPSRNPLFQVGFVFQDPPATLQISGLKNIPLNLHSGGAMYDLHWWLWAGRDGIEGYLWYNIDIFEASTISRLVEHFKALSSSLLSSPSKQISQVEMMSEGELQLLGENANGISLNPPHESVLDWISSSTNQNPRKVAALCGQKSITYLELSQKSDYLAGYLIDRGVKEGDFIAIGLDRSIEMLVSLLAILKTGAAYVPTDPEYPIERLSYMLTKSAAKALITTSQLSDRFKGYRGQQIWIDKHAEPIENSILSSTPVINAESLMYAIFTSGSTGQPKGVQVSHGNAVNFLASMAQKPGCGENDRLLAITTLSFDIAVLELFLPLVTGATVIIAQNPQTGDGRALLALLEQKQISILQATPTTWRLLIAAGWQKTGPLKALCGGEAFPADLKKELLSRCDEVWNMYGPTETTVWSTCYQITDADKPVLIGKPIANTTCYVMDETLRRLPTGLCGELYIGGKGVTQGYLGQPELTQQRFITSNLSASLLYKTGDLVRLRADGNIEYLDRIDNQVKIRGYRIELEEIEAVLLESESIHSAAVIALELSPLDKRLVAYFCNQSEKPIDVANLRRLLRQKLPEYMVPQHFVALEQLPLTPNGKIDRKALPQLFDVSQARLQSEINHAEKLMPTTPLQKTIASIWEELLGVDIVGIDDDFFDLGGHSLLAVELFSRLNRETGINLPLATLFPTPTVAALAETYSDPRPADTKPSKVPSSDNPHSSASPINPWDYLVTIKESGKATPFYCVHGIGGNVINYYGMTQYLDPDQPFYGLQCRGLDGISKPFTSLFEMAEAYVKAIQKVRPNGPYMLGGGSMGGYVAVIMAGMFRHIGENVSLVCLFDTFGPSNYINTTENGQGNFRPIKLIGKLNQWWQKVIQMPFPKLLRTSGNKIANRVYISCRIANIAIYHAIRRPLPHSLRYWYVERHNLKLLYAHRPDRYDGKVVLFRCPIAPGTPYEDPYMGWSEWIENDLEIHEIPASNHEQFMESPETRRHFANLLVSESKY
jgi:amino acid adenylation domain-containing protein